MPGGGASPAPTHVKDLGTTWAPAPKTVGLVAGQLAALLLPTFRHLRGPLRHVFFLSSSNSDFTTAEPASSPSALFPVELQ